MGKDWKGEQIDLKEWSKWGYANEMQNPFLVFALSKMKIQNKRSCLKQTNDLFYVSFGGEGGLEEWLVTNFWFSAFVYSFFFFTSYYSKLLHHAYPHFAKCEVDQMNGSLDMQIKHTQTDRHSYS